MVRLIRNFLLPGIAVTLTLVALWYSHLPSPVAVSNIAQVKQEGESGGYQLIDVKALWSLYQSNQKKILLVDTRQEWEYRAGHIAGSVNFPIEPTWWGRWQKKKELKAFLGPDREKSIVFY